MTGTSSTGTWLPGTACEYIYISTEIFHTELVNDCHRCYLNTLYLPTEPTKLARLNSNIAFSLISRHKGWLFYYYNSLFYLCRIDSDGVIKVADFGLAVEEEYSKGYFRQDKSNAVKLPFRWMALESLRDGVFTEKTDVVSRISMRLDIEIIVRH